MLPVLDKVQQAPFYQVSGQAPMGSSVVEGTNSNGDLAAEDRRLDDGAEEIWPH